MPFEDPGDKFDEDNVKSKYHVRQYVGIEPTH